MRLTGLLLLATLGCASDSGRMYAGPVRPSGELAMVELSGYAQKNKLRWIVTSVSLPGGPSTKRTFNIPAGTYDLEVAWRVYDTSEGSLTRALLVPVADHAKKIEEGVTTIPFSVEAGRFYRLRWASRSDATISGAPRDMELMLIAAGMRPELVGAGAE